MERAIKRILALGAVVSVFFAFGSVSAISSGAIGLAQGTVQTLAGFALSYICLRVEEVIG